MKRIIIRETQVRDIVSSLVTESPYVRGYMFDWDDNIPLRAITIGSFSPGEKNRNFNGSFSLVRVYDKALEEDEILQNINFWSGLAVDPASKLTTTWGRVKTRY